MPLTVEQSFITASAWVSRIATDGTYIYWINVGAFGANSIGRANLDGTGVNNTFIASVPYASCLAVDSAYIYWADDTYGGSAGSWHIGRANLDGTGANSSFIAGSRDAYYHGVIGLAVDSSHIYWIDGTPLAVKRASLDGSGVVSVVTSGLGYYTRDLALDGLYLYISDNGVIRRANLDGSGLAALYSGADVYRLAPDSGYLWWITAVGASPFEVRRTHLDGSAAQTMTTAGAWASGIPGFALDSGTVHLYWADKVGATTVISRGTVPIPTSSTISLSQSQTLTRRTAIPRTFSVTQAAAATAGRGAARRLVLDQHQAFAAAIPQTISPVGIASRQAAGGPIVHRYGDLFVAGIASAQQFGDPMIGQEIRMVGIPPGDAFGAALAHRQGDVDVLPGIPPGEAFGRARVRGPGGLDLFGVPSGEMFGMAIVAGAGQLYVPGIDSGEAVGDPGLTSSGLGIRPPSFADPAVFGEPSVELTGRTIIRPSGIPSAEALGLTGGSTDPIVDPVDGGDTPPPPAPPSAVGTLMVFRGNLGTRKIRTPRNRLVDRKTGEVYPWPVNHATEDAIKNLGRQLTRSGISATGRLTSSRTVFLNRQPKHPGPMQLMLHGALIDPKQDQYHAFLTFFRNCDDRTFDYVDAPGDSYQVVIVGFDARRKMTPARLDGSYFEYTLEVEVLAVHHGPLKGYAAL